MSMKMDVLSWNMRSAGATRESAWDYFREMDPCLALLQDVTNLPDDLHASYDVVDSVAVKRDGTDQRFKTMILVKGQIGPQIPIEFPLEWMNEEFQRMGRNLVCRTVQTESGLDFNTISVYSPAWPISDRVLAMDIDTTEVCLPEKKGEFWLADLLWFGLQGLPSFDCNNWIISGDFNLCDSFDRPVGRSSGNKTFLSRMAGLGLTECLREFHGKIVPTYGSPRSKSLRNQIDHMFVSPALYRSLVDVQVGEADRVLGQQCSDHLPIIAHFQIEDSQDQRVAEAQPSD